MPENRKRVKKKKVQKVNKDIEVILEMNSDVIIHRLLNTEGDIEPFMLNEYNFINFENENNKKKFKTKN
ncbi:MAG: hypothetical protein HOP31_05625 [Ignavibacteria bacterium]|nr:hypothetical protein [Ignavibacteria bacterium]